MTKRTFISCVALLLCAITLLTAAFADGGYTTQVVTSGNIQPITYHGGSDSTNTESSYCDPVIVGYRFTCWRSTDYLAAVQRGETGADLIKYYTQHKEDGIKLGHSINIMCNAVMSTGHSRTDYANNYGQVGLFSPHMLTNGNQTDFLDKISLAHIEYAGEDEFRSDKLINSAATGLMLMDYSGSTDGVLDNVSESSSFEFTVPIYQKIEESTTPNEYGKENPILNNKFHGINGDRPLTIYSGYYVKNQDNTKYLNQSAANDAEANNLYTYVYGFQYASQTSTDPRCGGKDMSPDYLTISDIDYEGDVLPFNQYPMNIINSADERSWTNRNAALIATLCGLTPRYGTPAYSMTESLTESEFGVFDYIIVEPIMMYYYYYTRYYVTVSDNAIVHCQAQYEKYEDNPVQEEKDVWHVVYSSGYKWLNLGSHFPAAFGPYAYVEEEFFGVDGVMNATEERGYPVYTSHPYFTSHTTHTPGLDHAAITSDPNNNSGNNRTNAFTYTCDKGYTMFCAGVDNSRQERVMLGGEGQFMWLAPRFGAECLLGCGIFFSGNNLTPQYKVIYHTNSNNGNINNDKFVEQSVPEGASSLTLRSFQAAFRADNLMPAGKTASNYWTFTDGPNGYGVIDNSINGVHDVYPSTSRGEGKVAASTVIKGTSNVKAFFDEYGIADGMNIEVHLYASWNTKSLVTTLDRTYTKRSTLQEVMLQDPSGKMFFKDANRVPVAISVVKEGSDEVIQLQRDAGTGYQWFPVGDKSFENGATYRVVYTFDTALKSTGITQSHLGGENVLTYCNEGKPQYWSSDTNVFFFDFYSFDIEAPGCAITATITDYPDSDGKQTQQSNNGILQMKLARGCAITYSVTINEPNLEFFKVDDSEWASIEDWTVSGDGHIHTSVKNTYKGDNTGVNAVVQLTSGINDKAVRVDYAYEKSQKAVVPRQVWGKQKHKYVTSTGSLLLVIPHLDDAQQAPFENYYVEIGDKYRGQSFIYSTNGETGTMKIPANAKGVVQHVAMDGGVYLISVSATDATGRRNMLYAGTVSIPEPSSEESEDKTNKEPTKYEVHVYYFPASMTIKTQCGGNHSGVGGSLVYSLNEGGDVIDSRRTTLTSDGGSCSQCGTPYYSAASGIGYGYSTLLTSPQLKLSVSCDESADWHVVSGSAYNGPVNALCSVEYKLSPYHYITTYLDDRQVDIDTLNFPVSDGHEIFRDFNGYKVLRGTYRGYISDISKILNGATKNHRVASGVDRMSFSYNEDMVTRTTLYYYTVTTGADTGYSSTAVSSNGTSIAGNVDGITSNTVYILSRINTYNMYSSCTTGLMVEFSDDEYNKNEYSVSATLNVGSAYLNTTVSGRLNYGSKRVTTSESLTSPKGTDSSDIAKISQVQAPSNIYWRSNLQSYDLQFIFRVNSVPYDSLSDTINGRISLNGENGIIQLAFGEGSDNCHKATGEAPAGTYNLFLGGVDTGMQYTVSSTASNNIYTIDFYTLRAAAGTGIADVSIKANGDGKTWNGTLPYIRNGKKFATTLAIWPKSIREASLNPNINIDAHGQGEYWGILTDADGHPIRDADGKPVEGYIPIEGGYAFNHWDTKRPTSNIKIKYANNSSKTTTTRSTYVNVANINHATVVQAEAVKDSSPIVIPPIPEHNSIYYGVKVRTFLDGRITTPWTNLAAFVQLSDTMSQYMRIHNGVAAWADVLDLVQSDGITAVPDPYKGKSASASLAPSQAFDEDSSLNAEDFYSGNNAYIANQYVYIDAIYYTQTIQTQVNGVNTPPWSGNSVAQYTQSYKGNSLTTTTSVNDAGAVQTIMLKGMSIDVSGKQYYYGNYTSLYQNYPITSNHGFVIPYYTVDMKAICESDVDANLKFNGDAMPQHREATVMAGTYRIQELGVVAGADAHTNHIFMGWALAPNDVYKLEYVDSGDGSHPYPTLTYTGERRASKSKIPSPTLSDAQVYVCDETHLVARYTNVPIVWNLKLNVAGGAPVTMFLYDGFQTTTADSGVETPYVGGTEVHVSALLDDTETEHRDAAVTVNINLSCPHCRQTIAYDNTVLECSRCGETLNIQNATGFEVCYATAASYPEVAALLGEAAKMDDDAAATQYLAANGVVLMKRSSSGMYSGTIPYNANTYHLYVNGIQQPSERYDITNSWSKQWVFDNPTWEDYSGSTYPMTGDMDDPNGNSGSEEKHSTGGSEFYVIMDENREYTVHAVQQETGVFPSDTSIDIDFASVTVYTSTDYVTKLPYATTKIRINGSSTQTLSSAYGHTFIVSEGSSLKLEAQRADDKIYAEIFNGTVNANKTFLLSYNTVTVDGDAGIDVEVCETHTKSATWLANYAVDSGALQSVGTTYSVNAISGTSVNKTFYHLDSTVTVNTTPDFTIQLVAVNPDAPEMFTVSGAGRQYVYMLDDTPANRQALDAKNYFVSSTGKLIGISTNANLSTLAAQDYCIDMLSGITYVIIVNEADNSLNVVAAAGQKFELSSTSDGYTFAHVPNGVYEIYMNGNPLVSSVDDIISVDGAVSKVSENGHRISVTSNGYTISGGANFGHWDIAEIPGTAHKTYVQAGTSSHDTNTKAHIESVVLDGTINYHARNTSAPATESHDSGSVELKAIGEYRVEVYLDDALNRTFAYPVTLNGSVVTIGANGKSDTLYYLSKPTLKLLLDAHSGYANSSEAYTYSVEDSVGVFKVYYYSVDYSAYPEEWGYVLPLGYCLEAPREENNGPTIVAKGTVVSNVAENPTLVVSNHSRNAVVINDEQRNRTFLKWILGYPGGTPESQSAADGVIINQPTHFTALFEDGPKEYKVTLYNKTSTHTRKVLDVTANTVSTDTQFRLLPRTSMQGGRSYIAEGTAPATIMDTFGYAQKAGMTAIVDKPYIASQSRSYTTITLNLTGRTSEKAHLVKIVNKETGEEFVCNVAENTARAVFDDVPSGYYQLYIDNIKYVTQFEYDTHVTGCRVADSEGGLSVPHYATEASSGGVLYVAPLYNVYKPFVSHWSQYRFDRSTGAYKEYAEFVCRDLRCSRNGGYQDTNDLNKHPHTTLVNWSELDENRDPERITYYFECDNPTCGKSFSVSQSGRQWKSWKSLISQCRYCHSTHFHMTMSDLLSPSIDEHLNYYVYSGYQSVNYAPADIVAEVEMAYPVYVQSVVDGNEQYPFYAQDDAKIEGASVLAEYSVNGYDWYPLEAVEFDDTGLAVVNVPMGAQYRFIGATRDEWYVNTDNDMTYLDSGFSLRKPFDTAGLNRAWVCFCGEINPSTATNCGMCYNSRGDEKCYIIGDGDYDNDGAMDDPGITYYVHYYTVTARAAHGIATVSVHGQDIGAHASALNPDPKADTPSVSVRATYQRGAMANVSAVISDGTLPVYIRITKDGATYTGRTVYLSKSATSNDRSEILTYNPITERYENSAVEGTAEGTTYYVWVDGKTTENNPAHAFEYTGVSLVVKPFKTPVEWNGNCDATHPVTLNDVPFMHSFTVYRTTLETAKARDNVTQYSYEYAADHPTDPADPNHDPDDPDNKPEDYPDNPKLDEFPENTVYYYTLEVTGDDGTTGPVVDSGTYLEGKTASVGINTKTPDLNKGTTPLTVTLYLDGKLWTGQTVTIGGKPAYEFDPVNHPGQYRTDYHFVPNDDAKHAVIVKSPDATLLDEGTIYGYINVTSTRTYEWKAWSDYHSVCSKCGIMGNCCGDHATHTPCNPTTQVYCTNCHWVPDANNKEQSCCTNNGGHNFVACVYDSDIYGGSCTDNMGYALNIQDNTVTMKHETKLHGVTTHKDTFTFTGDTVLYFYTLHVDGDAGIDSVTIDGDKYEETEVIFKHGVTATEDTVYHKDIPERLWTQTHSDRTFFKEVVVLSGRDSTSIAAAIKKPVKNHAEAKTQLSIELTINGQPYLNRKVTIGGYTATDADNDGIYVTDYAGFVGGKTYQVTVDGRNAGRIYLESYRSYRWLEWSEPWTDSHAGAAHQCVYHGMTHTCNNCLNVLAENAATNVNAVKEQTKFVSLTARTEIIDEFHVYVDPNLDGGPDPYEPTSGDPDDPYKDPTDPDYDPDKEPGEQSNPEYDPDHEPDDNPDYDPTNPTTPKDPSDDPDNFDPDDKDDGFYEDAPIPFYTLTINTKLDDNPTDDFPIKFENLTTGETLYIIPDGQTYHVYDKDGNKLTDVPYIVTVSDGSVVIALQDGDRYRISTLTEVEDKNGDDIIDIRDIDPNKLNEYEYTKYGEDGEISKQPAEPVNVLFYTLTVDVYSDGVHKMPEFGTQSNGVNNPFNNPVWLDDVVAKNDASPDSNGDTDLKPVTDHHTVKVYRIGTAYDVDVKTADDDNTGTNNKPGTGYLVDHKNGTVEGVMQPIKVYYYSLTTDHHGGFKGVQINYKGKTHVSAITPSGATSNAIAKAYFLKGELADIDATLAKNNTWYRWTGTETYLAKNQKNIRMDRTRAESAWAKTYYNVHYYLHDKGEGWYHVSEDDKTISGIVIDNRNWNTATVKGEPNKYIGFDPFRTHLFVSPNADHTQLYDALLTDIPDGNVTISIVVNAEQVGGQSFVDFYYTRDGFKEDPTPDTPDVPDPTPEPPEEPTPTPQDPEDWDVDEEKEYVSITYWVPNDDGTYRKFFGPDWHLAGTNVELVAPPDGKEFVGWFLQKPTSTQSASGLIGGTGSDYLLCENTDVYAVYVDALDLGITANDIHGGIKVGSAFMTSATIVNHNNLSVTPNNLINAVLTVKNGATVVDRIVVENIVVPGNGTQLVWATVDTTDTNKWSNDKTYTITWELDVSHSRYVDKYTINNQSALNAFNPGVYNVVTNTARPGYSTKPDTDYRKDTPFDSTGNTTFSWEYWTWHEHNGYNGHFGNDNHTSCTDKTPNRKNDQMKIAIILTPENESGLRTYTAGAFGIHNYVTRSGYGLSMHRPYNDLKNEHLESGSKYTYNWPAKQSHITLNSGVGKLEVLMTFPEFNYAGNKYTSIEATPAGGYYTLRMCPYTDYETNDYNDQYAHYTPMWLPGTEARPEEYKPVTYISGMWTPLGELRATVQQGQYTTAKDMNFYGIYTNEIIIKGSLYDDLYPNP